MKLEKELQLKQGFTHREHEAVLGVYYTAALLKKRADEFFRDYGTTDVQFNVMMLLHYQADERGGLMQVDLSHMMLVNRANITSLIDRMEHSGIVKRNAVPEDRRYYLVQLTEKGEKLLQSVEPGYMALIDDMMSGLDDQEQGHLIGMLERVREKLGRFENEPA